MLQAMGQQRVRHYQVTEQQQEYCDKNMHKLTYSKVSIKDRMVEPWSII